MNPTRLGVVLEARLLDNDGLPAQRDNTGGQGGAGSGGTVAAGGAPVATGGNLTAKSRRPSTP